MLHTQGIVQVSTPTAYQTATRAAQLETTRLWTRQFGIDEDEIPKLNPPHIKRVQEIVGTLMYYVLAIDNTMLVALGDLASEQAQPKEETWDKTVWILNYAATHPDAEIQ